MTSTMAMLMVIIGSTRVVFGPAIGAAVVILLEHVSSIYTPERWPLILGGVFVITVMFLRGGITIHLVKLWKKVRMIVMEALKIEGLSKNFGALEVLKDVSLTSGSWGVCGNYWA